MREGQDLGFTKENNCSRALRFYLMGHAELEEVVALLGLEKSAK